MCIVALMAGAGTDDDDDDDDDESCTVVFLGQFIS